jgi:hypothetical protein
MAKCPKCGASQDWWKVLHFDKTHLLPCTRCGALLAFDSQRATILMGGAFAALVFPETNLLQVEIGLLWIIFVLVLYAPFFIAYTKFVVVEEADLCTTEVQERHFQIYAKNRRRQNLMGHLFVWGGFLVFSANVYFSRFNTNESIPILALLSMGVGFVLLVVIRCPYCKKHTLRGNGGRCINCHREIDVSD